MTVTPSVALAPLPVTVKLHVPAATGVTVNADPLAGEIVAMPAHVVVNAANGPL